MIITGFSPRPSQLEVLEASERFLTVDAGRRWGKSLSGLNWLLKGACERVGESWWLAPIYSQSKMAFRTLTAAARRGQAEAAFRKMSESEMRAELINGSAITFKSADNPDNLRGEGLQRVVVDEAARVQREVWEEVLRPAVSDTAGKVLFISTPKGKNWFYELWTRGYDPAHPDYRSWKFPTSDNPKVPAEDIEQAQRSLPVDVFSQEYLAEFLDNNAGVFRNVDACIGSMVSGPVEGRSYYMGLDLARLTDFTVMTILDDTGRQVYLDRFNLLDWVVQKERVASVCRKYRARCLLDSTGIGDPIYEDLRRMGLSVEGYKFTSESKKKLIESLMISFEQRRISILPDKVQENELKIFEYDIGPSGGVRYSAPEGYHDDCVIALALANWNIFSRLHGRIISLMAGA
jgi:phage FluMu gp28-like protein